EGTADMNMMTHIDRRETEPATKSRHLFLDECGNPSDRSGPDLTKARPIGEVIRELGRLRSTYSIAFWEACSASGIDVSVMRTREGEDRLMIGLPCDCQEELRRPRYDALVAQLEKKSWRREMVIDLANMGGRFADNQPFASVEDAAAAFLDAGGRIRVRDDGGCEENRPLTDEKLMEEGWSGYPLRRLVHRYQATLRQKGGREAMKSHVLAHGRLHEPSGWTVLEKGSGSND